MLYYKQISNVLNLRKPRASCLTGDARLLYNGVWLGTRHLGSILRSSHDKAAEGLS